MVLTDRERLIALISSGIAVFSLYQERGELPENTTIFDFILKVVPEEFKPDLTSDLIDEVFASVSGSHSS